MCILSYPKKIIYLIFQIRIKLRAMTKIISLLVFKVTLLSFSGDNDVIEFNYPKNEKAVITMATDKFKKFEKEWRGSDYYYLCENKEDHMICSVLFFKLNEDERKLMVEPTGNMEMAGIPYIYFSSGGNLKPYEKNDKAWGAAEDDFMFRQADIFDFRGMKVNQKHMYAYAMFAPDLFVNIHLSKENCTPADSTIMRKILDGLKKKKISH